jgi:hypothetical protein
MDLEPKHVKYIHIGFGKPYIRSYHIALCPKPTSIYIRRSLCKGYSVEASSISHVFDKVFRGVVYSTPVNIYRYSYRIYHVYIYSDSLWRFIDILIDFSYKLNRYCRSYRCIDHIVSNVLNRCGDLDICIDVVSEWLSYIEGVVRRRIDSGRKALYKRFAKKTTMFIDKLYSVFPDIRNIAVFKVDSIFYSSCVEESINILRKFYRDDQSHRYAENICRGYIAYLFARDSIFAIAPNNLELEYGGNYVMRFKDQYIFIDGYRDTEIYTVFKLINTNTASDMVNRIYWVSILGYDKYTNQIFIHYVPPTLALHSVETCREWLMGLVDSYGFKTIDGYSLVEV